MNRRQRRAVQKRSNPEKIVANEVRKSVTHTLRTFLKKKNEPTETIPTDMIALQKQIETQIITIRQQEKNIQLIQGRLDVEKKTADSMYQEILRYQSQIKELSQKLANGHTEFLQIEQEYAKKDQTVVLLEKKLEDSKNYNRTLQAQIDKDRITIQGLREPTLHNRQCEQTLDGAISIELQSNRIEAELHNIKKLLLDRVNSETHPDPTIAEDHFLPIAESTEEDKKIGFPATFYRRAHGGIVKLKDDTTYSIPESMVRRYDLLHEAELLVYLSSDDEGKGIIESIDVLLQGDDEYSPVISKIGYVHQAEDRYWYAIDPSDPDIKYRIHYKDIAIQQPIEGTPCAFNFEIDKVSEGLVIVRLARLLAVETNTRVDKPNASKSKKPKETVSKKSKPEPFLTGTKIVVIGGEAKWFESVVRDTGAEYIHNDGRNVTLVTADLQQADALFLLLTSNSHKATTSAIDVAKANGVPHYRIEGSKGNLRLLLQNHQKEIRG